MYEHGLRNLTFHGNDYSARSVETANRFWDDPLVGGLASAKGKICRADSTDLASVPDGAFDLAYTGYIGVIENPLDLDIEDDGYISSAKYCRTDEALARREQDVQEDWYAKWVTELVRIAKPGGYVGVESGAESWCSAPKVRKACITLSY